MFLLFYFHAPNDELCVHICSYGLVSPSSKSVAASVAFIFKNVVGGLGILAGGEGGCY